MRKNILFLFIILTSKILCAQNVNFDWVAHFGQVFWEKGKAITADASGNIYTVGYFAHTIDFDPGPGVYLLSSPNETSAFISKLDQNKQFIWAKKIQGMDVHALSIKIDGSGNNYILGTYSSRIDLDPGPGVYNGVSHHNIFIIKLNSAGEFIWGKTLGPCFVFNVPFQLALDESSNIYITGTFGPSMDFDPGPGIYNLNSTGNQIDLFILKLNTNGDFIWARNIGNNSPYNQSNAITTDAGGNVYITGNFGGTIDFDPGPGVHNLTANNNTAYILKLSTHGNLVWVKLLMPSVNNSRGMSLAIDHQGNIYIGGNFLGMTDFDPGPAVYNLLSNSASLDPFICKLDALGNFIWAKSIGGSAHDNLSSISLDALGNVYATGSFYLTTDFDPGPGVYNLTSAGLQDVFVYKLDATGNFAWVKATGGSAEDLGTAIAVDAARNVFIIGAFEGIADFDPGPDIINLNALGYDDIFILKLSNCSSNTFNVISATSCGNYLLNNQTYDSTGTYLQTIPNASGCDSIITLNLTINRKTTLTTASICEGQTYFAGGANQIRAGIYKDTLQTIYGCDSIITTNLNVHPKPIPDLGRDRNICFNTAASITPGSYISYVWQDNSTQPVFTVSSAGTYWVNVTNTFNCTASDTLKVLAIDTIPTNFLPPDQLMCNPGILKINIPGYSTYSWSTGEVLPVVSLNNPGVYYVTVTNYNNCVGTDTIVIKQNLDCIPISIPNAFTPNKDGLNDIFKPVITQQIVEYSFIIFNRYGQKIFFTNDLKTGWDGSFRGQVQPIHTYVYIIRYKNLNNQSFEYKGSFNLLQ